MAASLTDTADPKRLVPGNPEAIHTTAGRFTVFGDALVMAGEGLKTIDTEAGWKGKAADGFREAFDGEPKRWITSGDAFHDAAGALTSYASTLQWAQGQAKQAADLWKEGEAATKLAKAEHEAKVRQATLDPLNYGGMPIEFNDPGEAKRNAAQDKLNRARQQLHEAGDGAEKTVDHARDKAPKKPNFAQKVSHFFKEAGEVLWEGGKGAIDNLASIGNAIAHHPEDALALTFGAAMMAGGGAMMGEGTGITIGSGGTLAAGGVPLAIAGGAVAATGATIAGVAGADIMHHAANDNRVTPTHGNGGTGSGIKSELDNLSTGNREHVRIVRTEDDLRALYEKWSQGGVKIDQPTYNGDTVRLENGTTVGLREFSKTDGRPAIDIKLPDGKKMTVHIDGS